MTDSPEEEFETLYRGVRLTSRETGPKAKPERSTLFFDRNINREQMGSVWTTEKSSAEEHAWRGITHYGTGRPVVMTAKVPKSSIVSPLDPDWDEHTEGKFVGVDDRVVRKGTPLRANAHYTPSYGDYRSKHYHSVEGTA